MNKMPQTEYKKITQALNFLARENSNKRINKLKAIKLLWLADRYHLRKYGRPITWDIYEAMLLGPVGSIAKDIAEQSQFLDDDEKEYASKYIKPVNKYTFESAQPVDPKVFSASDITALKFVVNNYGSWDKYALKDLTHKYPEWKKYEELLTSGAVLKVRMEYKDFFDNPSDLEQDFFAENEDILETSKEIYEQKQALINARIGA